MSTKEEYLKLLEHSFVCEQECSVTGVPVTSRLVYLSDNIFDFTTYDDDKSQLFTKRAVEVCEAINNKTTFDYIGDMEGENYMWFLLMCNMPFFTDKLNWGTSIRGAWWDAQPHTDNLIVLESSGIYDEDEEQIPSMAFSVDQFREFMKAVVEFAKPEMNEVAAVKS